ncbi:MAG: hypothetical protein A2Z28_03695 [Chloroflexi bacterium RBG_16_51_9]|nr:MAG: hypothetical protein A2Z28_03695 [Chloroflexi bacterium RBG_16_51_9]
MGKYNNHKIGNYSVRILHNKLDIRNTPILHLLPFFWDTEIALDLQLSPLKGKKISKDIFLYKWELTDLDSNIIKEQKEYRQYEVTDKDIIRHQNALIERAISLVNLHPHREYILYITLQIQGSTIPEKYQAVSFNIDDRDSYYMQVLILIIGISFAFVIGLFERGCSPK